MSGFSAFGTILQKGNAPRATATTWTPVAGVTNISGPGLSLDTIDVTAHDSPGAFEEAIATIIRQGEVTVDVNYDPNDPTLDASTGVLATLVSRAVVGWRLIWPVAGAPVWEFDALCTGFEPTAPYDDKLAASVTLKVTGQPSLA